MMNDIHYDSERQVAAGQFLKEGEYWLQKFSGEPEKSGFPADNAGSETPGNDMTCLTFTLAGELLAPLTKLSNQSDSRLYMILTAGLVMLLHRYTGNRDIIVGSPIYRQDIDGDFVNTVLPLRVQVETGATFKQLLLQVRQTIIEADENQNYPMATLLYKLNIPASGERFPLFDTAILLDNIHDKKHIQTTRPILIFSFSRVDERVDVAVDYSAGLYRPETIERIVSHYCFLLQQALGDVNTAVAELTMVPRQEQEQALAEFNDTNREYPLHKTIQQLFEEQAALTPEKTAIITPGVLRKGTSPWQGESQNGTELTYRELNERANRLTRLLQQAGIGNSNIVGLMLEYPADVVAGMLAILKAGGAYLPMDAKMPGKRVVGMLNDSRASCLLTESALLQDYSFTALQGLQEKRRAIHFTPRRKQILDLDSLPIPNRSLVDYEKYNQYIGQVLVKNIISLQTARGCPFNCYYCSKIWPRKHVARSADSTFKELKMYYDMGFRRFSIFDDIFNVDRKNGMNFFEKIIKHNLDLQLFFPNGLRGDLLDKEYIDLLVEAGLAATALALETASPRMQKLIGKNLNLDKFRENVAYFCDKYPQVILELFTMHGFPTETEEEARLTMDFIKQQKWLHFPYVFILKIYPGTEMANLAMEHGVMREDILKCEDLAFHELSPTSPFKPGFTRNYQAEFLNDYFLNKERLRHVLPYQAGVLTEDEIVQKYDSYLPHDIKSFADILELAGIDKEGLGISSFLSEETFAVPDLNNKLREVFPRQQPDEDALRVLILDLSQYFSGDTDMLYDVVEPPLGAMYVLTYLQEKLGSKINGKILKSRIDFDNYDELKNCLLEFRPDVIGVRSLTFYRDFFHKTLAAIRQWGISAPIIAGGPYATRNSDTLLQDGSIDIAVISEGETTFCEIVEKILANNRCLPPQEELEKIGGIAYVPLSEKTGREAVRQVMMLDFLPDALSRQPVENLQKILQSTQPAYIIYTSGSTGMPKGVVVEHRNVINLLHGFVETYNLQEDDRVIQLSNYTFDPSVEQIFGTLFRGAILVMPPRNIIADREAFLRCMEENRITIINFVPAVLKELLGDSEREKLKSLRAVISGGEKLDDTLKDRLIEAGYELYNQYGPTETTIDALRGRCSGSEKVNLGRPITNVHCYVLGKNRELMPVGVPGELYIGGAGVTRGYLNNPELTDERFIDTASCGRLFEKSETGTYIDNKLYKTGDICRWLPDGRIDFMGRSDHQVKIRGFRIELGEIENRILRHRDVKEAVVLDRESASGDTCLCAYFVLRDSSEEGSLTLTGLRDFLARELPAYMIPAFFVQMERIPITANGKVDRQSLPVPAASSAPGNGTIPENEIEANLMEIWSDVLGVEKSSMSRETNFFEIGGDSIKVIQIAARLRKYGYKVESGEIFLNPTIRQLSPHVKKVEREINQEIVAGEVPLTAVQKLFFEISDPKHRHHYNQAVLLHWEDGISEEAVRFIFSFIQRHHDALRLVFRPDNDRVVQVNLADELPLDLRIFDLRHLAAGEEVEAEIRPRVDDIQTGIDLTEGPLMKLGLFKLSDGDRLLIVIHHLVSDGISWRILFEDIDDLYRQYEERKSPVLPLKTDSYKYWAEKLYEYADSEAFLAGKNWWIDLETAAIPQLPRDFPVDESYIKDTNSRFFQLSEEETRFLLTKVNAAFNTEVNDILLCALALGVEKSFGQKKVLISLEGHGREEIIRDIDISRTVGWFTSTYPVVLDISDGSDLSRQIKEVKESLHRVPQKGIGYGILRYLTSPQNKSGSEFTLKPQIGFNYLGQFDSDVEHMSFKIARESSGSPISPEEKREFDLNVGGIIANQRLNINIRFSKRQFKPGTIDNLLRNFEKELQRIIAFCAGREDRELTPSDLTYKELSIEEIETIGAQFDT